MSRTGHSVGSVSATGKIAGTVGYTEANVHVSLTREGELTVEGSRRAATDEEIVADLDEHQLRALRDMVDHALTD